MQSKKRKERERRVQSEERKRATCIVRKKERERRVQSKEKEKSQVHSKKRKERERRVQSKKRKRARCRVRKGARCWFSGQCPPVLGLVAQGSRVPSQGPWVPSLWVLGTRPRQSLGWSPFLRLFCAFFAFCAFCDHFARSF